MPASFWIGLAIYLVLGWLLAEFVARFGGRRQLVSSTMAIILGWPIFLVAVLLNKTIDKDEDDKES